jgi:hypothetical protein
MLMSDINALDSMYSSLAIVDSLPLSIVLIESGGLRGVDAGPQALAHGTATIAPASSALESRGTSL